MVTTPFNTQQPITLAVDQALFTDDITNELTRADYHLLTIDLDADMAQLVSSNHIDAIITSSSFPLDRLMDASEFFNRDQLLLLIVPNDIDNPIASDLLDFVDAVLPANAMYLGHQLRTLLRLRKENLELQRSVVELSNEISAQKRKTTEVEVLKNAIVRNVSHELRTPLLQVKSAVSLIAEDGADEKLISYAKNATAKLESHVQNITMLGHSLNIKLQMIMMGDVVEAAKRNLARIWTRKDDTERIRFNVEKNLPPIRADKQGLGIVMQLLMDNALKFGDSEPVDVSVRKKGNVLHVAVRDYGIGICEDKRSDIFEAFFQIDSSSTRRYGGAGVGLALVKLLLDYHHTKIHVDSELGKGSTFWFEIPYVNLEDIT